MLIHKKVIIFIWSIVILLPYISIAQTTIYTGHFYSPTTTGAHTDDYLNVKPNSGVTENNSWNVYHQDGSSIFSVFYAKTQPYLYVGSGKATDLYVNGKIGIGTTTPSETLHINGNIRGNQNGALRISTGTGYLDIGPQNNLYSNFSTDRPAFYFNKPVEVEGAISSYSSNDLTLRTGSNIRITALNTNGYVGIGTSTPQSNLHVIGNIIVDSPTPMLYTGSTSSDENRYLYLVNSPNASSSSGLKAGGVLVADNYGYANPGKNDLVVKGVVSIGTSNPNGYTLAVNGKIGAKEVRVEKSSAWPDYVFAKEYKLPSLQEVARYINEHKHLEDVPTAAEVEKDGQSLGEMNIILLKKIEELTLYLIQQDARIRELEAQVKKK